MTVSAFDSKIYGPLFADPEIAALFSDRAEIAALLQVEAALARAEGRLGVIPADAAARIDEVAATVEIPPESLAEGTADAGIPIPALVEALRAACGGAAGGYVHWGATTHDIMDCGLLLRLGRALDLMEARLGRVSEQLAAMADRHRGTVMAARTRAQQAVPTSFGLKAAGWLAPLLRHRRRLAELRPRLMAVQFGGAAGTLAALGDRGIEVMAALAEELDLGQPSGPWHVQRDGLAELAGWLSLVTGSLGKLGADVILLSQSEVGEVAEASGGGSSTMPQKSNPVRSEALVATARFNAGLLATIHQAQIQEQERGGPGWQLEWLTLPQMVVCCGGALKNAEDLLAGLMVRPEAMAANLAASKGLILAEAAAFALAAHMPKPDAQALVKAACAKVAQSGRHLVDILAEDCDAAVDWTALRDPGNYLGANDALVDRVLQEISE